MQCTTNDCTEEATYSFIWTGPERNYFCDKHYRGAQVIAEAMGFWLSDPRLVSELEKPTEAKP